MSYLTGTVDLRGAVAMFCRLHGRTGLQQPRSGSMLSAHDAARRRRAEMTAGAAAPFGRTHLGHPSHFGMSSTGPLVLVGSVVQYVSRQNSPRSYVVDRKRLSVHAWGLRRPGRSPLVVNSVTPPGAPAAARTARSPRCRPPETETRSPRSQARNQLTSRGGTGPSGAPSLQRTPMSGPDRETPNPRLVWIVESGLRCGDVLGLRGAHERGGR